MTKVVINRCWGGFSISLEAARYMAKRGSKKAKAEIKDYEERKRLINFKIKTGKWPKGSDPKKTEWLEGDAELKVKYPDSKLFPMWYGYGYDDDEDGHGYSRTDPLLVEAVEKLGSKASGEHSNLQVIEIPDGVEYIIDDYDGMEKICEKHREW